MKNKGYANFGEHAQIRCIILIMGDVQLVYCGVNPVSYTHLTLPTIYSV